MTIYLSLINQQKYRGERGERERGQEGRWMGGWMDGWMEALDCLLVVDGMVRCGEVRGREGRGREGGRGERGRDGGMRTSLVGTC